MKKSMVAVYVECSLGQWEDDYCFVNERFVIPVTQVPHQLLERLSPTEKLYALRAMNIAQRSILVTQLMGK